MSSKILLQRIYPLLLRRQRPVSFSYAMTPFHRSLYDVQPNGRDKTDTVPSLHVETIKTSSNGFYRAKNHIVVDPDPITAQILEADTEGRIFDVLTKHKFVLNNLQVFAAIDIIWELQKQKPDSSRNFSEINEHTVFQNLCVAIETNAAEFDDTSLIKVLYALLRLKVDPASSSVQQIVIEATRRIQQLDFADLSRFAVCLQEMSLRNSPIAGQLASRLQKDLNNIESVRQFSNLMYVLMGVCSADFQTKLVKKAMYLFESDSVYPHDIRRILQAVAYASICEASLLDKCASLIIENIDSFGLVDLCISHRCYSSLDYHHIGLKTAISNHFKQIYSTVVCPLTFSHIFDILAPDASTELKIHLEDIVLDKIPDMSFAALSNICRTLRKMNYRSVSILKMVCRYLKKRVTEADLEDLTWTARNLIILDFIDVEISKLFGNKLKEGLEKSIDPHFVSMIVHVLSNLDTDYPHQVILAKVKGAMSKFDVAELNRTSVAIKKILLDQTLLSAYQISYGDLRKDLNRQAIKQLDQVTSVKLQNAIMLAMTEEGIDASLLEETMEHYNKLLHKVSPKSAPECAIYLMRTRCRHKPLLDTIANIVVKQPNQLNYLNLNRILLPYAFLNYYPSNVESFLQACIEKCEAFMDQYHPNYLIKVAHDLAMLQQFPEKVINHIFGLDFLTKLDDILEGNPIILRMQWGSQKKVLPPGAERVAIEFLSSKSFCTNSQHPLGYIDMKRRHLEIMGYRYVAIPHFEWFSMKLSSSDDYREYLREKLFAQKDPDYLEGALVYKMLPALT
uniref:FAST kinase domain-containing protein 1-like n=1 Tax=Saccoglossus kowalevskii TaxID=10224 RepID=A0ABM0GVK6_SACKO|nr:PREDICTED: FAST kinase domain-containing protein 1-like [Saccoglossus kowalevskii]